MRTQDHSPDNAGTNAWPNAIRIRENALFIADAHYPHHGNEFMQLLKSIVETNPYNTDQLFLMGDIFDLLFGYNEYIESFSRDAVDLLKKLSCKIEIHYIEGNHDFCLERTFPEIKVYSRRMQPVYAYLGNKKTMLSHGDRYDTDKMYDIYSALLRNRFTLNILKPFQYRIINDRMKKLGKKSICGKTEGIEGKLKRIISAYPEDAEIIIEGHFHYGRRVDRYISLPSLACQKQIAIVRDAELVFISPSNRAG